MQWGGEMVDEKDIAQTIELLTAFVQSLTAKDEFGARIAGVK